MNVFDEDKYEYTIHDESEISKIKVNSFNKDHVKVINIAGCYYLNWTDCKKMLRLPQECYNSYVVRMGFSFIRVISTFLPKDRQVSRYISEEGFYDFILSASDYHADKYRKIIYEALIENKAFIKVLNIDKAKSLMSAREERLRELNEELDEVLDKLHEYCKEDDVNEVWDELDRQEAEKQEKIERKRKLEEQSKWFMETIGRPMWRSCKYSDYDEY